MEPADYDQPHPTPFGFRTHHIQLSIPAGAEQECREFWVAGLGFREVRKPPQLQALGGLWVRADSVEVHLGVEKNFSPARKAHPGIRVTGIEGLADTVASLGMPVTWDERFPGQRRFHTTDNCGNRLEFMEPVGDGAGW